MQLPKAGEKYRHYKSAVGNDQLYEIIGLAKHTEIDDLGVEMIFVVYKPLNEAEILIHNKLDFFVRPLSLFLDEVEWEGKRMLRFARE